MGLTLADFALGVSTGWPYALVSKLRDAAENNLATREVVLSLPELQCPRAEYAQV